MCLPVTAPLWRKFTVYMRFLWMVDEVECRWNAFVKDEGRADNSRPPRLAPLATAKKSAIRPAVIDVSWSEELSPHIERFARLNGFHKLRVLGVNANRGDSRAASGAAVHKSHVSKSQEG